MILNFLQNRKKTPFCFFKQNGVVLILNISNYSSCLGKTEMIDLNKLFTEEISGITVLVSYNDETKTFKVINKNNKDLLKEGDEITVNNYLDVNGARVYAPRFMANYPVTKVNANASDLTHMSAFSVLEFLRLRHDSTEIEMVIYPRDMQEGCKILSGIKIPLGECLLQEGRTSSMVDFMISCKESLDKIKKVVVRTFKESDPCEVAVVDSENKFYPFNISKEDKDSFANSLVLILSGNDVNLNLENLLKALFTDNTMSVISQDLSQLEKNDTITECFSVDDLINSHIVVFESSNLNALSRTLFHVHPEANLRKWKVSEIKESIDQKGFYFEVQGKNTDELLSDDLVLGSLISENVYITHRTPLHEASPVDKAVFALMNGISVETAVESLVKEQKEKDEEFSSLKECDSCDVSGNVPTEVLSDGRGFKTSNIEGIEGKILAPMKKQKKDVKNDEPIKVNSDLKYMVLKDLDLSESVLKSLKLLKEDEEQGFDMDLGLGTNSSENNEDSLFGNSEVSSETSSSENSNEESEKNKEDEVGKVLSFSSDDPSKLVIQWPDGSETIEDSDNLIVSSSLKSQDDDSV